MSAISARKRVMPLTKKRGRSFYRKLIALCLLESIGVLMARAIPNKSSITGVSPAILAQNSTTINAAFTDADR